MPSMISRILILGLDEDDDYLRSYAEAVRESGGEPVRRWLPVGWRGDDERRRLF